MIKRCGTQAPLLMVISKKLAITTGTMCTEILQPILQTMGGTKVQATLKFNHYFIYFVAFPRLFLDNFCLTKFYYFITAKAHT